MRFAKPFITPGAEIAKLETINVVSLGESKDPVPHPYSNFESTIDLTSWWNPSLELQISSTFSINVSELRDFLQVQKDEKILIGSRSYCNQTKIQTIGQAVEVTSGTVVLNTIISRYSAAKSLDLRFSLGMQSGQMRSKNLQAVFQLPQYAQLWSQEVQFRLTGSHSMMNIRWVSPEEEDNLGAAMWKFHFYLLEDLSPEDWFVVDASAVLEVQLNEKFRQEIEENEILYSVLWSELAYAGISRVMLLPESNRQAILRLLTSNTSGGSWLMWLRDQFLQAFDYSSLDFFEYQWFNNHSEFMPRLQAAKMARLKARKISS
jgi:hypothetical protein